MIFKLKPHKDKYLEEVYEQAMKELGKFYESQWTRNRPVIHVFDSRAEINLWRGTETGSWLLGWADGRTIYLLDHKKYATESSHTFNPKTFTAHIAHELSHLFYDILSRSNSSPRWLCEGVAIYTSGQLEFKKPVEKFTNFLSFQEEGGEKIYEESGLVVKLLIDNFGKKKLLKLIKALAPVKTKSEFDRVFTDIYGFKITYSAMNRLLQKSMEKKPRLLP